MDKFPCIKCGLCCKHINIAVEAVKKIENIEQFPYKWDKTGRCEKLDENNLCSVYENRPLICDIDRMIEFFNVDKRLFYNLNILTCNQLLKKADRTEKINLIP